MPEVANPPLPTKLLEAGVRDMVRICDGRMSGTANGTVVLFTSPSQGWEQLYVHAVMQADPAADLDFLVGSSGDTVSRESH